MSPDARLQRSVCDSLRWAPGDAWDAVIILSKQVSVFAEPSVRRSAVVVAPADRRPMTPAVEAEA